MPRESLDAQEDLRKQARRQVTPGQLEPEVPGMSDETPGRSVPMATAVAPLEFCIRVFFSVTSWPSTRRLVASGSLRGLDHTSVRTTPFPSA